MKHKFLEPIKVGNEFKNRIFYLKMKVFPADGQATDREVAHVNDCSGRCCWYIVGGMTDPSWSSTLPLQLHL